VSYGLRQKNALEYNATMVRVLTKLNDCLRQRDAIIKDMGPDATYDIDNTSARVAKVLYEMCLGAYDAGTLGSHGECEQ
jgi:hypothetical protein